MKFTDRYILNLKPQEKRYIVKEDNAHGNGTLAMRVGPNGHKAWEFSFYFEGRVRRMTLGTYPTMTVAQAHAACGDAMAKREQGVDPGTLVVAVRAAERAALTFKELTAEYIRLHALPRKKSAARDQRALDRDVTPVWGPRKADAITRRDVIALLDSIVARGAPIQANRTLALVRKVFNFAIGRDILQQNPCYRVPAPGVERQSDRVLSDEEIKSVLRQLPTANMADESQLALQLQLLTAQRCGEVMAARWDEIDLKAGWWTIPATKAKNKLAHRVPLSEQAMGVLAIAKLINSDKETVFPSPRKDAPMVETAIATAVLRNLDHFKTAKFSPHDLRRTAASHMTGMGLSRLVVSKILNHVERGVTAVYDRHSYDGEKRAALVQWGARVEQLLVEANDARGETAK